MRETLTLALKLALKAITTPGIFTKESINVMLWSRAKEYDILIVSCFYSLKNIKPIP